MRHSVREETRHRNTAGRRQSSYIVAAATGIGDCEMSSAKTPSGKKEYAAPKVIHTEKIETQAVVCSKSDDSCAASGPIQS